MGARDRHVQLGRRQKNEGLARYPSTILPNRSSPHVVHHRFLMESSATGDLDSHPLEVAAPTVISGASSNEGFPNGSSTAAPNPWASAVVEVSRLGNFFRELRS